MGRRRKQHYGSKDYRQVEQAFRKLDRRAQWGVLVVVLAIAAVALIVWWQQERRQAAQGPPPLPAPRATTEPATGRATGAEAPAGRHGVLPGTADLLLGNPSGATSDPANRNNYLMLKPYYALSYNNSKGSANWVSWRIGREDLGDAPRKRTFDPDTLLPRGFFRAAHKDYSGSGFDRGHLCPHSDRAANAEMSFATFVMTNIIPQAPDVNQKGWAYLEDYCRDLVRQRNHLYVVAGPAGKGGRGTAGKAETIAGGKITVPAECWKVVVVVPEGGGDDDLAKIGGATRVITVVMPNDNEAVRPDWSSYRTTPADVESRTGYRFFDRLPAEVAEMLRQKTDRAKIPLPINRGGAAD